MVDGEEGDGERCCEEADHAHAGWGGRGLLVLLVLRRQCSQWWCWALTVGTWSLYEVGGFVDELGCGVLGSW